MSGIRSFIGQDIPAICTVGCCDRIRILDILYPSLGKSIMECRDCVVNMASESAAGGIRILIHYIITCPFQKTSHSLCHTRLRDGGAGIDDLDRSSALPGHRHVLVNLPAASKFSRFRVIPWNIPQHLRVIPRHILQHLRVIGCEFVPGYDLHVGMQILQAFQAGRAGSNDQRPAGLFPVFDDLSAHGSIFISMSRPFCRNAAAAQQYCRIMTYFG